MSLVITLTGTGNPIPHPERAGGGVLVQADGVNLQFDAGRATIMRLAAIGLHPEDLAAVFLTHHHSDHLQGLDDLAYTRKNMPDPDYIHDSTIVVAPDGPLRHFLDHLLDPWKYDFEVRDENRGRKVNRSIDAVLFEASDTPMQVWESGDVKVSASSVRHEPVVPAVGYRVDSPSGSVAISGDTRVCEEMERLSEGVDVLVHEAMLSDVVRGRTPEAIMQYHSDSVELGAMADRAGVKTLILTHLIPPTDLFPAKADGIAKYEEAVRSGGFKGELHVGDDLTSVTNR